MAPYDWLCSFEDVGPAVLALLPGPEARVLVVGCGNSPFSSELFARGYRRLTNVDNCASVVAAQRDRYPMLEWVVGDCRALPFGDGAFDAVLDKGLLDNLYCYADADAAVAEFRAEAARVLAPAGRLVALSCHDRAATLAALDDARLWACAVAALANPRYPRIDIPEYQVAVCRRGGGDAAALLADALAALDAGTAAPTPGRLAHLDRRASGRRHSAIVAGGESHGGGDAEPARAPEG